jgi:hypothetical protein
VEEAWRIKVAQADADRGKKEKGAGMIEVLKQLVDALENHSAIKHPQQIHYRDAAIQAGKKAIAELESQEPWCMKMNGCKTKCEDCPDKPLPTPRTWVDLTRTQMQDVYFAVLEEHRGGHQMEGQLAFGEALQAKIREKNT